MSLDVLLGGKCLLAACKALKTARPSHFDSECPNWHRMPYEQHPFFQKPLHFLFLEAFFTGAPINSCFPCAKRHLCSQGQWPNSENVLHSSVLCLAGLVRRMKDYSSRSDALSYSVVCLLRLQKGGSFYRLILGIQIIIDCQFKFQIRKSGNRQIMAAKGEIDEMEKRKDLLSLSSQSLLIEQQMRIIHQIAQFATKITPIFCSFFCRNSMFPFPNFHLYNQIIIMNSASLKEGTKSNVIIIPGVKNQQPKDRTRPTPHQEQIVPLSSFDGNIDLAMNFYISQINKLTAINNTLGLQLRRALEEKRELADLIASFEQFSKDDTDDKRKRVRRCANEIQRKYICQVAECGKSYGTEGSMAQHMKLKHPEIDYVMTAPEQKGKKGKKEEYEDGSESQS